MFSHRRGKYAGTHAHIPPPVQQVRSRNEISPAQQQPATPSPPPLFYDYSEHFQQSNDTLAPVDQGVGQRQRRVKEEHGRIYESPLRVFSPDEHGLAASIQNQSQGILSSSVTQAGNSALNKDIVTADTQEHMRLLPDKGTDFESYNESSDPVSAGDAIAHGDAISGFEDPDAAVSTPQSSRDYAAGDVEVRILRTSIASFVLFPGWELYPTNRPFQHTDHIIQRSPKIDLLTSNLTTARPKGLFTNGLSIFTYSTLSSSKP